MSSSTGYEKKWVTYLCRVDDRPIGVVLVDHVLLAELEVEVLGALVFLVEDGPVDVEWVCGALHRSLFVRVSCTAATHFLTLVLI